MTTTAPPAVTTTAPAGVTTTTVAGFDREQDLGNKREGETFTISNNCDFAGTVSKSFNGAAAGSGTGPCPPSTVNILDDGVGTPTALGAGRIVAAIGVNLAQANRTPRVRIDGVTFNANALGVRNALVLQGSAAGGGQGRWTNYFTIVVPGGAAQGGALSRTGAMVLRWSLLGASLIAVGVLFAMAARRRSQQPAS